MNLFLVLHDFPISTMLKSGCCALKKYCKVFFTIQDNFVIEFEYNEIIDNVIRTDSLRLFFSKYF